MTEVTRCPDCGYDPADYTAQDRAGTLRAADPWWEQLLWRGGTDLLDVDAVHDAADAVHNLVHGLRVGSRVLHKNGVPPTAGTGRVSGLFASNGGVPKQPIDVARIGFRGVEGDRQASRRHHGRPWQALCLWSTEVIERLAAEGHPIGPGRAGENVTIAGIDWAGLRAGVRLGMGDVVVETTVWALPCSKNAPWFMGRDFDRMHHQRERGVSRIYAWVIEPGVVHPGDAVIIEP
jgi:MOSC domain-containing protein YiiM